MLMSLTASTDNRGNSFVLDKYLTTKFPLNIVLIELAYQLQARGAHLRLQWLPREHNQEADDLTNLKVAAFDPKLRVRETWDEIDFKFLRTELGSAQPAVEVPEEVASSAPVSSEPLRVREPW